MQQWRPHRRPSQMRVTVEAGGTRQEVGLLDVSEAGMQIACTAPLPVGTLVEVSTPRIARRGSVCWADGRKIGLVLTQPLSSAEQAELAGMSWGN